MATNKKPKLKNGITLFRNEHGEYYFHIVWSKELSRVSETYKKKADMLKALRRTHLVLYDFFVNGNTKILHDQTNSY